MSSFTPGPWHVDIEETWPADAPCFIAAYSGAGGGPLCIVDNREDAFLIAAAPELLNLAELVVNLDSPEDMSALYDMATKLIAKARGEE